MRSPLSARVTGFDYTTHHAYTTEVAVDGRSWSLAIRYNTFFKFYAKLLEVEPQFKAPFPPKGGLFFSPLPEERQVQLDDFVQNTLTFYDLRGRPDPMGALLDDLLEVSEHLAVPDKESSEEEEEQEPMEEAKVEKKEEESALGGLLKSSWAKALVSAAMQAVVVNTFQENAEAAKAKAAAVETPKPSKSVDAVDMDTPTSPTSRASLTKTPRQSATVAPLEVASSSETKPEATAELKAETKAPAKTEAKPKSKLRVDTNMDIKADNEPVIVANVAVSGVRDRIAVWEHRASSPTLPTPRGAGRRSSSCSSAGDQAPVVPLGVSDVSKPVVEVEKQQQQQQQQEQEVVEVKQEENVNDNVAVESETATAAAEEPSVASKEDATPVEEPSIEQTPEEEEAAAEEEVAAVEAEKVNEAETEATKTEAETVEEPETMEESKPESDGYDSDASDEIRRLGLEKLDVSERLRFYRHPVFFQGFYCRVRTSSIADEASRA